MENGLVTNLLPDSFTDLSVWRWLAAFPAICACLVSLTHIFLHIYFNKASRIKPCILRMLATIPIYAIDAQCCLAWESNGNVTYVVSSLRDLYEPVMLGSFVQFLLAVLGQTSSGGLAIGLAQKMDSQPEPPDFYGLMKFWKLVPFPVYAKSGEGGKRRFALEKVDHIFLVRMNYKYWPDFVQYVLIGILQYLIAMVAYVGTRFLVSFLGGPDASWFTSALDAAGLQVKAASCFVAIFHLFLLAVNLMHCKETHYKFHNINLEAKFLAVKGIVFFVLVQNWVVRFLHVQDVLGVYENVDIYNQTDHTSVQGKHWLEKTELTQAIQDFLLSFELFLFAVCHLWAYGSGEFNDAAAHAALEKAIEDYDKEMERQCDREEEQQKESFAKAVNMLRGAIREAEKNGLVKKFKCRELPDRGDGKIHYEDITGDPTKVRDSLSIILHDPLVQMAQDKLRERHDSGMILGGTVVRKGPGDVEITCDRQWRKVGLQWWETIFGIGAIVSDIWELRQYAHAHRQTERRGISNFIPTMVQDTWTRLTAPLQVDAALSSPLLVDATDEFVETPSVNLEAIEANPDA